MNGETIKTFKDNDDVSSFFVGENNIVYAGYWGGVIKIWDIYKGLDLYDFSGHIDSPLSLALLDSSTLISGSARDIRLWDVDRLEYINLVSSEYKRHYVAKLGKETFIVTSDGDIDIREKGTLKTLGMYKTDIKFIEKVEVYDSDTFAICGRDGKIQIWRKK